MKRSVKITAVASALAVVAALSGCSSTSGGGDKVLSVWTFKQSEVKALEAVGKAWGAKSGMTVKVSVFTPYSTYATKIQAAAKAHTLPDILSLNSGGGDWQYAQAGIVQDLTKDFSKSWQGQFLPGLVDGQRLTATQIANSGSNPATSLNKLKADHFYSIPYLAGTPGVVFANKKMLEAAGINTTKPPTTWQEWVADMRKTVAKNSATGGVVTGMQNPETGYFWLYNPMAWAYLGPDAFKSRISKKQTPSWTSPESVKTLELYDQLTPLWAPGVLALQIDQADQAFATGKAAWDVGGTYTLSSLTTFGMDPKDVMLFGVPAASGGKNTKLSAQPVPLVGGSITTTSKHKTQALDFLKYLTSVEGATTFSQTAIDLSATKLPPSSMSSPLLKELVDVVTPHGGAVTVSNPLAGDPPAPGTTGGQAMLVATDLTQLVAKTKSVQQVASEIATQYATAWKAAK